MAVPIITYDDLRSVSTQFLARHAKPNSLPIQIEEIIDIQLQINITCQPSLHKVCGVDAFVNSDCTAIYVEGSVYLSKSQHRLRFSLAHELAHILLHRDQIAGMEFKTMGDWKRNWDGIDEDDYYWLEWQANALAGLLLVPPDQLAPRYKAEWEAASLRHGDRGQDFIVSTVESKLAEAFWVSQSVIEIRCAKDGLLV